MSNELKTLKQSEVQKGDILLYSIINPPKLTIPTNKEELSVFFTLVIDRLIMWAENSNTTHAALMYDYIKREGQETVGQAAEATLPNCQLRSPLSVENMKVTVHRLPKESGLDGSLVLRELPELSEVSTDNNGYAMGQAVVAGLICLLRTRHEDTLKTRLILTFLKLLSYPLGYYADKLFKMNQSGKQAFFCSQLAAYCYDMTAYKTGNDGYRIHSPSNSPLGDTILDILINEGLDVLEIQEEKEDEALLNLNLQSHELCYAALKILEPENTSLKAVREPELFAKVYDSTADIKKTIPAIRKLIKALLIIAGKQNDLDELGLTKAIVNFQTSFIMPSDLENVFETVGVIE